LDFDWSNGNGSSTTYYGNASPQKSKLQRLVIIGMALAIISMTVVWGSGSSNDNTNHNYDYSSSGGTSNTSPSSSSSSSYNNLENNPSNYNLRTPSINNNKNKKKEPMHNTDHGDEEVVYPAMNPQQSYKPHDQAPFHHTKNPGSAVNDEYSIGQQPGFQSPNNMNNDIHHIKAPPMHGYDNKGVDRYPNANGGFNAPVQPIITTVAPEHVVVVPQENPQGRNPNKLAPILSPLAENSAKNTTQNYLEDNTVQAEGDPHNFKPENSRVKEETTSSNTLMTNTTNSEQDKLTVSTTNTAANTETNKVLDATRSSPSSSSSIDKSDSSFLDDEKVEVESTEKGIDSDSKVGEQEEDDFEDIPEKGKSSNAKMGEEYNHSKPDDTEDSSTEENGSSSFEEEEEQEPKGGLWYEDLPDVPQDEEPEPALHDLLLPPPMSTVEDQHQKDSVQDDDIDEEIEMDDEQDMESMSKNAGDNVPLQEDMEETLLTANDDDTQSKGDKKDPDSP